MARQPKRGPKGKQNADQVPMAEEQAKTPPVKYSMSGGFVRFLAANDIAIAFTSYQSGRLYILSRNPKGGLMVNEEMFRKAMGLHVSGQSFFMATLAHIHRMENILTKGQWIDHTYTHCFMPRTSHLTGILDAHDVGVDAQGQILFVNTRYNCLATLSEKQSFKPVWKPHFISRIIAEDRCHLNGLAMEEGKPAYVTAICRSDTIDGWRDRRADGGIVMDVSTNTIICDGLSMPHSPRVHDGRLWVLNSGTGELGFVRDHQSGNGKFEPVAFCPGFARGLSFLGRFALVGLSKPRYERFEGLALDDRLQRADSEPWCGIQVIDMTNGQCVHWFRIDGQIGELYDVAVIEGVTCGKSMPQFNDATYALVSPEASAVVD